MNEKHFFFVIVAAIFSIRSFTFYQCASHPGCIM